MLGCVFNTLAVHHCTNETFFSKPVIQSVEYIYILNFIMLFPTSLYNISIYEQIGLNLVNVGRSHDSFRN